MSCRILLWLLFGVSIVCGCGEANTGYTRMTKEMQSLQSACELYLEKYGRWPEGQDDLLNPPALSGHKLGTPLISKRMKDPWRREYDWAVGKDNEPIIISYGEDGEKGGSGASKDIYYSAVDGLLK